MSTKTRGAVVLHPKNNGYEKVHNEINIQTKPDCTTVIWYNMDGEETSRETHDNVSVVGDLDWVKVSQNIVGKPPFRQYGHIDKTNALITFQRLFNKKLIEQSFRANDFLHFFTFENKVIKGYSLPAFLEGRVPDYLFSGKHWLEKIKNIARQHPNAISIDWSFVDTTSDEELVQ